MKLREFIVLVFIILCAACAQQVSPGGGPVDNTAPIVVAYNPDSAKTDFLGNEIEILFNEYIQLKDIANQVTFSPPFAEPPEIKVKKKSVVIELPDSLKPNTTYTISFGEAISDITEANAVSNFKYIFSTGAHIDSLSIQGSVTNAFNETPEKGINILLYKNVTDSTVYKALPDYFGKTFLNGSFKIDHVQPGQYHVFALKDKNSSGLVDPEEAVAFHDSVIVAGSAKPVNMRLFEPEPTRLMLKKSESTAYGAIRFIFNKAVEDFSLKAFDGKEYNYELEKAATKDTFYLWSSEFIKDSLTGLVTTSLTRDTVELRLRKKESSGGKGGATSLGVSSNVNAGIPLKPSDKLKLKFNTPLQKTDTSYISLKEGKKNIPFIVKQDSVNKRVLTIEFERNPDSLYNFTALKESFTDILGLTNDTVKVTFKTANIERYGNVKMKITTESKYPLIIQLLNDRGVIQKDIVKSNQQEIQYTELDPGTYKFKVIQDKNNNGRWDTGNLDKQIQPEAVLNFKTTVTVRENWDQELDWNIIF